MLTFYADSLSSVRVSRQLCLDASLGHERRLRGVRAGERQCDQRRGGALWPVGWLILETKLLKWIGGVSGIY